MHYRLGTSLCPLLLLALLMECWCRQQIHHRHGALPGCSRCAPGRAAVRPCDPLRGRDTACAPCPPGTYSPHHSYSRRCYPCSRCGKELYVAHVCTPFRDTVCDSCHTLKGPHNKDFAVRCLLPPAPEEGEDPEEDFGEDFGTADAEDLGTAEPEDRDLEKAVPRPHRTEQSEFPLEPEPESEARSSPVSAADSSGMGVLTVLVLSAATSFVLFTSLAALFFARLRTPATDKTTRVHGGQVYGPVETADPVML